jgi:hypothetical protein
MFRAAMWLLQVGLSVCRMALQQEAHANVQALKEKRKCKQKCKCLETRVFIAEYDAGQKGDL